MADAPRTEPGKLPPWNIADLPQPRPFGFRNALAVIGPGVIVLSTSIGTGEWLLGPANVVKYGFSVMWIVTLGIFFQLVLNLQFVRYTMYTGEPVVNGFMRTRPGPWFWGFVYIVLALCQVGWPAWAANSAPTIFATFAGHLPTAADAQTIQWIGIGTFLLCIVIVAFGGKVERMLEWVNWFMVVFILIFLVVVNILFVKPGVWWEAIIGHFAFTADGRFMPIPPGADWILLGAFAGFAGNGGIGNVWTSNYIRDKGFAMGSVVGYIPSAFGGKVVKVSPVGSVFPTTTENMSRWRVWMKYLHVDQTVVWAGGCVLGMFLNVTLARALIPPGTNMEGLGAGAIQAQALADAAGTRVLWFMTLLNGFWILFGSQLTIVDGFVRLSTDILWTGSARVRAWARDDIRRVYYTLLVVFALWGCAAINLTRPFILVKIAANAAGFILVVAGIHILFLRRMIPREVRGSPWQAALIVLSVVFSAFFFSMNVADALGWIRK